MLLYIQVHTSLNGLGRLGSQILLDEPIVVAVTLSQQQHIIRIGNQHVK